MGSRAAIRTFRSRAPERDINQKVFKVSSAWTILGGHKRIRSTPLSTGCLHQFQTNVMSDFDPTSPFFITRGDPASSAG